MYQLHTPVNNKDTWLTWKRVPKQKIYILVPQSCVLGQFAIDSSGFVILLHIAPFGTHTTLPRFPFPASMPHLVGQFLGGLTFQYPWCINVRIWWMWPAKVKMKKKWRDRAHCVLQTTFLQFRHVINRWGWSRTLSFHFHCAIIFFIPKNHALFVGAWCITALCFLEKPGYKIVNVKFVVTFFTHEIWRGSAWNYSQDKYYYPPKHSHSYSCMQTGNWVKCCKAS